MAQVSTNFEKKYGPGTAKQKTKIAFVSPDTLRITHYVNFLELSGIGAEVMTNANSALEEIPNRDYRVVLVSPFLPLRHPYEKDGKLYHKSVELLQKGRGERELGFYVMSELSKLNIPVVCADSVHRTSSDEGMEIFKKMAKQSGAEHYIVLQELNPEGVTEFLKKHYFSK